MKRISVFGAVIGIGLAVAMTASAATTPVPFPSQTVKEVFVAAQTVTTDGSMSSWFTPGATVVFRAYAVDPVTHSLVDPKIVKYFYVSIPGQPNVKLTYGANNPGASTGLPWSGEWNVPASITPGQIGFKILIQIKHNDGKQLKGQFVQMPSATADLTVSPTAPAIYVPGASPGDTGVPSGPLNASLYVDTVNGSGPVGIAKRPIGCSLTNVYKRGEQVVVRAWGADAAANVLSNDNVNSAHFTVAGIPDTPLNYGAHGTLYFWANAFVIPATYPLGSTTIHVAFNLLNGKTATYDYTINVIP